MSLTPRVLVDHLLNHCLGKMHIKIIPTDTDTDPTLKQHRLEVFYNVMSCAGFVYTLSILPTWLLMNVIFVQQFWHLSDKTCMNEWMNELLHEWMNDKTCIDNFHRLVSKRVCECYLRVAFQDRMRKMLDTLLFSNNLIWGTIFTQLRSQIHNPREIGTQ